MLILFRDLLSNIEKSAKAPCFLAVDLSTKPAVDRTFIQFGLEFGECTRKYLPTSQAVSN
jgi:hypothetical protein